MRHGQRLALAAVLGLAALPPTAQAARAGGIKLGTWTAGLGSTAGGARSTLTIKLTKSGPRSSSVARLKLFRYVGICTFFSAAAPAPAPTVVTWTYEHANSIGPIDFIRSRQTNTSFDLDENQSRSIDLVIRFASAIKASGYVSGSYDPANLGGTACFTGTSFPDQLEVDFTLDWAHR